MLVAKYNANGNDFVIFHTFVSANRSALAVRLCNRYNGVGADGLIVLKPSQNTNEIVWEFYNNDGSYAAMCGNGSRAAAQYAVDNGLCDNEFNLLTGSGSVSAKVSDDGVEIELTSPKILANNPINEFGKEWYFYDTGVPHLVSFVSDLTEFDISMARKLRHKYNANINLAMIKDGEIYVRTYERGVENETQACGTGMAACFYGGFLNFNLEQSINVYPKSRDKLGLRLENGKIFFKGEVKHCFSTDFKI
ncbi:diaminopimelate epimerase [Campylobacter sp. faydin G-24]|uniref:Diaminopimelate epimerase n=1 Tax=Campylobacter anatolicus TaxID=2829105 RepID=A0ABS5HKN3_9BACT|nr:diaminopimelate epimerase [Campylobacter anatolicus]MBR8461405.1 diaminopimelate epimerase [Campylobacter anatolicus]MBR8464232.1 diaminopimelate epimerase [Campylobacter anatolicus]